MDYIPAPRLPEGMAEALIKLKSQSGDAWANMAQSLGNNVNQGMQNYRQKQQNQPLQPDQVRALLQGLPQQINGQQLGPGQVGPPQPINTASLFPRGIPQQGLTLASEGSKERQSTALNEMTTKRILEAQGLRGEQSLAKSAPKPVNSMHQEQYKAVYGHDMPFAEITPAQEKELSDQFKAKTSPKGNGSSLATDRFVQTEMDKADRAVNPLNANRGAGVGLAGVMKTRIATARENLNDPNMTPQQLASTYTDLAGIVQMGSPHESGIKDQDYSTWYTKAKAFAGKITNKTVKADSPDTVATLKGILDSYDKVYNKLINSNLDADKASRKAMLGKYPDLKTSYDALEKQIRGQYPMQSEGGAGAYDEVINKVMLGK